MRHITPHPVNLASRRPSRIATEPAAPAVRHSGDGRFDPWWIHRDRVVHGVTWPGIFQACKPTPGQRSYGIQHLTIHSCSTEQILVQSRL
jgi:hypothetical protein